MKPTPDFTIPITSDYVVSVCGQPATVYAMPTRYGQSFADGKPISVYDGTLPELKIRKPEQVLQPNCAVRRVLERATL
jgi:hypothetical protein